MGGVQMLQKGLVIHECLCPGEQQGVVWVCDEDMVCCSGFILLDQIIGGLAHRDVVINAAGLDPNPRQNDKSRR